MWEKPNLDEVDLKGIGFDELTDEEKKQITASEGGVGTCVGVGYSCWETGGINIGVCAIGGVWI